MPRGVIKKINRDRGFGFIKPDDRTPDVFFHCSVVDGVTIDDLNEGDKVSYDATQGERGPRASLVSKAA